MEGAGVRVQIKTGMWIEWDEIGARYGGSLTWDPIHLIRRMSAAEVVSDAQREAARLRRRADEIERAALALLRYGAARRER
jgi:hypothetical protein